MIDLELEKTVQTFLRLAIRQGLVASAHDLSDGGLAVAAAEACLAAGLDKGLGASLELPEAGRLDHLLFAEGGARILVSVPASQAQAWRDACLQADVPAERLGQVEANGVFRVWQSRGPLLELPVAQLAQTYEQAIPRRMGADLPPSA